jgi:hypothetical protein
MLWNLRMFFLFLVVMRGVGLGTRTSELVCGGGLGLGYPNLRFVIGFSSHFPSFIFICGLVLSTVSSRMWFCTFFRVQSNVISKEKSNWLEGSVLARSSTMDKLVYERQTREYVKSTEQ